MTRNSRSKVVTVSELGLLPSEDSILAPEWVPWAERVRPEDARGSGETMRTSRSRARAGADAEAAERSDEALRGPDPEEDEPSPRG